MTITVEDYRPGPSLDEELARLGYTAIHGWPDQAPVNAKLARAMLRPAGMTATTLALHRGDDGRLLAAAAVRWPATLGSAGRLWGPVVHPDARRGGLGRSLMQKVADVMATHPGVLISTTDIPESRKEGWLLFEQAGWSSAGSSQLLERTLSGDPPAPDDVTVRSARAGEYLAPPLAELMGACRPELDPTVARDTFERWTHDSRYVPAGLLLVEENGRLDGAAIVYPSPAEHADESPDAFLGDLLVAPRLDPARSDATRQALANAVVRVSVETGAEMVHAVVDDQPLAATLLAAGFTVRDRIRRYTTRGVRPS